MRYDPEKHHRRSIRLKGYDYTQAGAYFVTICTHERECLFGEVINGQVRLSRWGEIVYEEWFRTAELRPYVRLYPDEFVVMPNHVHGIIWIVETTDSTTAGTGTAAPCPNNPPLPQPENRTIRTPCFRFDPNHRARLQSRNNKAYQRATQHAWRARLATQLL